MVVDDIDGSAGKQVGGVGAVVLGCGFAVVTEIVTTHLPIATVVGVEVLTARQIACSRSNTHDKVRIVFIRVFIFVA